HGTARVHDVELALAEAFANLVQHAFRGTGSGEIQVTKSPDGGVACTLTDYGCEYHPPDGTPDGIMRESGYGWKLLHALTTTITYTRAQNQNRLCMNF
ncbi:MAG: ATP-binding protein, partial [Planktomarina sp.]